MIYLASPYSAAPHHNTKQAAIAATYLLRQGHIVYSPILHWHHAAQWAALPTDWEFWWKQNEAMLQKADELCVYMIDGWNTSKGVKAEVDWWWINREEPNSSIWHLNPIEATELFYG